MGSESSLHTKKNHHHDHNLANMQLGRLLTRSGLAHRVVSFMVPPVFFCLLARSSFSILSNPLRGVLLPTVASVVLCFVHTWGYI
jgi:hypothetical protein